MSKAFSLRKMCNFNSDIRRHSPWFIYMLFCFFISSHLFFVSNAQAQVSDLIRQSLEDVKRKSEGFLFCHTGIEKMHTSLVVRLGCTDCHGGNAQVKTIEGGHVKPKYPDKWKTSANPIRSYTLLNKE